jgi:hypothetical protein
MNAARKGPNQAMYQICILLLLCNLMLWLTGMRGPTVSSLTRADSGNILAKMVRHQSQQDDRSTVSNVTRSSTGRTPTAGRRVAAYGTRALARLILLPTAMAVLIACPSPGVAAEADRLDAKVIWVRGEQIYLAAKSPIALEPGSALRFRERGKELGTAEVTTVLDSTLIAARLRSGSLARVKKLERLEVTVERPSVQPRTVLRVGYPSPRREHPLFRCGAIVPRSEAYRADSMGERSYRLVLRGPRGAALVLEPDTLLVRLFDDATDEEIALESGEVDVGVFWPGEASTHIREAMQWRRLYGVRRSVALGFFGEEDRGMRGWLASIGRIDSLNQELFRGDLARSDSARVDPSTPDSTQAWFDVGRSCPGRDVLARFLNRGRRTAPKRFYPVNVTCFDPALFAGATAAGLVYRVACPVIGRPELRPYLAPDNLVNLFDCAPRKP